MHIEISIAGATNRITLEEGAFTLRETLPEIEALLRYHFPSSFTPDHSLVLRDNREDTSVETRRSVYSSPTPVWARAASPSVVSSPLPPAHAMYGQGVNTEALAVDEDPR